jgi:site-specific DNA recombinase
MPHFTFSEMDLLSSWAKEARSESISSPSSDKVQEIRQKKRELGAFANPHIKTSVVTAKIKCTHCNRSFQRAGKKNKTGHTRCWMCATRKAGQGNPCGTGDINEEQLKKIISEVLDIDEFDGEVFLEKVDHIDVTGKDHLEFFMTDGSLIHRTYVSTARRDAWTPEYKERYKKIKRSKDTSGLKNPASPYTGFIRCGRCGNSFYGQKLTLKDGTKVCYLRCRTKLSECPSNTIQESTLNALVCDVLGLEEYDEAAMDKAMDSCEIADNAVSFHFRDGHFEKRSYEEKKRGTPWTEERRQKALKGMKEYWSDPEHRKQASERMKKIRREKKWSSQ